MCQRNYGLWSQEPFSCVKPQISLDRDRQSLNKCEFIICVGYIACLGLFDTVESSNMLFEVHGVFG